MFAPNCFCTNSYPFGCVKTLAKAVYPCEGRCFESKRAQIMLEVYIHVLCNV